MALRFSFSDLPREEALPFARMAQDMSAVSQVDPLTWAGYADIPSTYIVATRDQALSVDRQRACVEVLRECAPEGAAPPRGVGDRERACAECVEAGGVGADAEGDFGEVRGAVRDIWFWCLGYVVTIH